MKKIYNLSNSGVESFYSNIFLNSSVNVAKTVPLIIFVTEPNTNVLSDTSRLVELPRTVCNKKMSNMTF